MVAEFVLSSFSAYSEDASLLSKSNPGDFSFASELECMYSGTS